MLYELSPYRKNISEAIKGPAIILLLLLQSFVLAITSTTASRLSAFYGVEPETVTWFSQIGTIGLVSAIPVYYRLKLYFKKSDLLMGALVLQVILSVSCYLINYAPLLLISNFFISMLKLICLLDFISLLTDRFPVMRHRAMFYGIYYTIARTGGELADILINPTIEEHDWQSVYLIATVAASICIVICLLLFHRERMFRKVPLYQVDWASMFFFTGASLLLCYVLTYGQVRDWFSNSEIITAFAGCCMFTFLFIFRQYHVKRPFWDLRVFKDYKQIPLGITFMVIMYLFYSSNMLFNRYAAYTFQGEEGYLSMIALITLCAYLLSFPLAGILLYRRVPVRIMLCLAFLLYGASLLLFFHDVQTYNAMNNLVAAYLLQGMAYGIMLTTLSTFTATNIPRESNGDRVMGSLFFRYIFASYAGYSLFSNWLFRDTVRHHGYLTEGITFDNPVYATEMQQLKGRFLAQGMDLIHANRAALSLISKKIELQATLLSIREISLYMAIGAVLMAMLVLFIRRFEMHEITEENKYKIV
ncbi:MFS transporter [Pedobacter cryoconitis]|uniref:DHA2 family multidrug resistance protein n=1 Tax=Pedobacter cryoconitis TaxID=188932 RepID=A0A7X0MLD7_9SPHI|nr:MFS transporter [Pedobacter cryoconitis]MBB6501710.1 DHA2 family multidrug resistance protein [Pedobacter cryoconitis]